MKKQFLFVWAVLGMTAAGFAADVQMTVGAPWKRTPEKVYSIEYSGKLWPKIFKQFKVTPKTYYRMTWEDKFEGSSEPKMNIVLKRGTKLYYHRTWVQKKWTRKTIYIYTADASVFTFHLGPEPKVPAKIFARNFKWEQVTPEMLKENILANGDFEDDSIGIGSWLHGIWRRSAPPAKIVSGQAFLNGEKSLELDPALKDKEALGMRSFDIPLRPGKTYVCSFWVKAEKPGSASCSVNLWAPTKHTGKHFYKRQQIKTSTDWNEYTFEVTIPTDAAAYPDLNEGIGNVVFFAGKNIGKMWLDDVSFKEK